MPVQTIALQILTTDVGGSRIPIVQKKLRSLCPTVESTAAFVTDNIAEAHDLPHCH